ncbi:unnamed protein product [Orchesella dallaii]|uniref:DNA polymerase delta catalytic subunit n=1 Tax=Orchesella dallaii TaxID=48710 RepID=A0ABP1PIV1_9HEXA
MEVLNISLDDNDGDTSSTELDEDPDFPQAFSASQFPLKRGINHQFVNTSELSKLFKEWERPPVSEGTLLYSGGEAQPVPFQFLFLDSVSTISSSYPPSITLNTELVNAPFHTVMRLFGVTRVPSYSASQDLFDEPDFTNPNSFRNDHTVSVCCNVHGFLPYFYALPTTPICDQNGNLETIVNNLKITLNNKVSSAILSNFNLVHVHDYITQNFKPIIKIECVEFGKVENSIFHFPSNRNRPKKSLVLKIFVGLPQFVGITGRILDEISTPCSFQNFETNINNNIRFLTDSNVNIPGCTWIELPAEKYYQRSENSGGILERESHSQIEVDIHYRDIIKPKNQPTEIPPLRVLSFDLECRLDGVDNKHGQVIQIGAVLSAYGSPGHPILGKVAFVLGTCDPLPNTKVIQFYDKQNPDNNTPENLRESEALMLISFRDFVIQMDPDILTGYNIKNFDFPYLIGRAENFYHEFEEARRFAFLGRLKKVRATIRPILNHHKRMNKLDKQVVNVQGRIVMDMFPLYFIHDTKRSGVKPLSLKSVAKRHLQEGEEKDDVKYTEINDLQNGDSKSRNRLAKYCVQDSFLPVKLMRVQMPDRVSERMDFLQYYWDKARLGGTILRYLVNKSRDYDRYFKQVRVQKNNGKVKYYPDSPAAKLMQKKDNEDGKNRSVCKFKLCNRTLFTEDD